MTSKTELCRNCARFKEYYRKGFFGFCDDVQKGLCTLHNKIVDCGNCCSFYERADVKSRIEKMLTPQAFDEIAEDIRFLIGFFKNSR